MDELDRHSQSGSPRDRVADYHYDDILIAEGLYPVTSDGLFQQHLKNLCRIWIGGLFIGIVSSCHDSFDAEEFVERTIFRWLPLVMHQLGRPHPSVADNHIAARVVEAL